MSALSIRVCSHLADEVINLRIDKIKVTRSFIHSRAWLLAEDAGL